ncbi:MAG TPA: hypothetical protein VKQ08_07650 [Cyclobacteriaceae bacterium]|nr:hypothetical protein [Cyclobacteriaceae bacterium]
MKTLKKVLRIISLVLLIILAVSGLLSTFLPNLRERYQDKKIRIEQVDKKRNENENDAENDN